MQRLTVTNGSKRVEVERQPETEHFVGGELRSLTTTDIPLDSYVAVIGLWDEAKQLVRATRLCLPNLTNNLPPPTKPK